MPHTLYWWKEWMIRKCADPRCASEFRYLHEGRILVLETGEGGRQGGNPFQRYWLYDACAKQVTLRRCSDGVVRLLRRPSVDILSARFA